MIPVTCVPTSTDVTASTVPVAVTVSVRSPVCGLTVSSSTFPDFLHPANESTIAVAVMIFAIFISVSLFQFIVTVAVR